MSANKEQLKSMLQNFIKDDTTSAELDFHNYVSDKMKEVSGFKEPVTNEDTSAIEDEE